MWLVHCPVIVITIIIEDGYHIRVCLVFNDVKGGGTQPNTFYYVVLIIIVVILTFWSEGTSAETLW